MNNLKPKSILLVFAVAICCLHLLPHLLSYGLFMDGAFYSSISRNMAEGYGTFWKAYFTGTWFPEFFEHPSLAFLPQSWCFKLFGDAFWLEAVYGGLLCFILLALMVIFWRRLENNEERLAGPWFVILFVSSLAPVIWTFSNNMLENTISLYLLLSVFFIYRAVYVINSGKSFLFASISGVFIFLAFLTKGPGALFPIVVPFLAFAILRNISLKTALLLTLSQAAAFVLCVVLIVLPNDAARNFFSHYYHNQIEKSMSGHSQNAPFRLYLLKKLFYEAPRMPLAIGVLLWIWQRGKLNFPGKTAVFFLCIGLAGSLPYLVSPKQMAWYIVPSLPFYMIALALVFNEQALWLEQKLADSKRALNLAMYFSFAAIIIALGFMFANYKEIRRDKSFFTDIYLKHIDFPKRGVVSVYPHTDMPQWELIAYMQRYYRTSITDSLGCKYCIVTKGHESDTQITANHYANVVSAGSGYVVLMKGE